MNKISVSRRCDNYNENVVKLNANIYVRFTTELIFNARAETENNSRSNENNA